MANNDELRNNLFSFRDAFKDYTDCYTVIGGTDCKNGNLIIYYLLTLSTIM